MPVYSYIAIEPTGLLREGSVDASDLEEAQRRLEARGLTIIEIKGRSKFFNFLEAKLVASRVKRIEVIEVVRNLATILSAGIPLLTAVEDTASSVTNKVLKKALLQVKESLIQGNTFSDALKQQSLIFPDIVMRLASIGETTGRLDTAMKDAADHLQRIEDIASMIKRALMYPMFALVTTGGALIFWLIYVLPKILVVMKEMQVKIPLVTRVLMMASNFVANRWYILVGIVFFIYATYVVLNRNPKTKYFVDLIKINFPIVKHIIYNKLLALFAEQMRILTAAGIIIDRCFQITADAMGSEVFRRAIYNARERLIRGEGIANSLKPESAFPPIVIRMVQVGEQSGNLDSQFKFLSDFFFQKLEVFTEKLGKTIEPILIAFVGGMFALVAIGLLMPLYDLITKIK